MKSAAVRFVPVAVVLALLCGCVQPVREDLGPVRIDLVAAEDGALHFEVSGFAAARVDEASLRESFRVYTIFDKRSVGEELPAIAGSYVFGEGVLRFRPRFPLEPGLGYSARLYSSSGRFEETRFDIPRKELERATTVAAVYPSVDVLPENLLKFYIHFSAPMSVGMAYENTRLLDSNGKVVKYPFLELDEELWDPWGRRLTIFIDPGRIKQGVLPNKVVGPVFKEGESYTLEISDNWKDAAGARLRSSFRKSFRVSGADRQSPLPAAWKLSAPGAESREPLKLAFAAPLDHALLHRLLWVENAAGERVEGEVRVEAGERGWSLRPDTSWRPGEYRLMISSTLEDLAGNGIDKPFEVDVFEQVRERVESKTVSRAFTIRPRRR
ncbi:MAG: hypothetical protein VCD16_01240 [Planctomycetota bacterium]